MAAMAMSSFRSDRFLQRKDGLVTASHTAEFTLRTGAHYLYNIDRAGVRESDLFSCSFFLAFSSRFHSPLLTIDIRAVANSQ